MRKLIVALAAFAGGACAPINGNERGGLISWGVGYSAASINTKVEEYCQRYGRVPRTRPNAQPNGGLLGPHSYHFECVRPEDGYFRPPLSGMRTPSGNEKVATAGAGRPRIVSRCAAGTRGAAWATPCRLGYPASWPDPVLSARRPS